MSHVRELRARLKSYPEEVSTELSQSITSDYLPPGSLILRGLGITAADLEGEGNATVSRRCLRVLIGELAARASFDEEWYAHRNPDVTRARQAGQIKSLREHFMQSGYIEGRSPTSPPFDPVWYRKQYPDIAAAYPACDPVSMHFHFLIKGYQEGRAGTPDVALAMGRWLDFA